MMHQRHCRTHMGLVILLTAGFVVACGQAQPLNPSGFSATPNIQQAGITPSASPVIPTGRASATPPGTATNDLPPTARTALAAFMDARLARQESRALSYLTPQLRGRVQYQDILPASSPRWLSYRVIAERMTGDQVAETMVEVSTEAGTFRQAITLERQDAKWLVSNLGPRERS